MSPTYLGITWICRHCRKETAVNGIKEFKVVEDDFCDECLDLFARADKKFIDGQILIYLADISYSLRALLKRI